MVSALVLVFLENGSGKLQITMKREQWDFEEGTPHVKTASCNVDVFNSTYAHDGLEDWRCCC